MVFITGIQSSGVDSPQVLKEYLIVVSDQLESGPMVRMTILFASDHGDLCLLQGSELIHFFEVSIKMVHEYICGFVIYAPYRSKDGRGSCEDKRPCQADHIISFCQLADGRVAGA